MGVPDAKIVPQARPCTFVLSSSMYRHFINRSEDFCASDEESPATLRILVYRKRFLEMCCQGYFIYYRNHIIVTVKRRTTCSNSRFYDNANQESKTEGKPSTERLGSQSRHEKSPPASPTRAYQCFADIPTMPAYSRRSACPPKFSARGGARYTPG